MPKHWTENLPDSWQGENAGKTRILGRSIKADHNRIKELCRDMAAVVQRIDRSEKLCHSLIGDTFSEEEMEAIFITDELPDDLGYELKYLEDHYKSTQNTSGHE